MTDVISFPGLGLEFTINRVAFSIGGLDIYWYAILISAGFALGLLFAFKNFKEFGLDGDRVIDVILIATIFGIVGARAYYVALEWDRYKGNLAEILNFRNGGLAIYGALIFGLAAAFFAARWRKVKFLPLLDLVFGAVFIGQAVGRWGNFVNMEAFGGNTSLPWGMTSQTIQNYITSHTAAQLGTVMDASLPVHPTFLYESIWCAIGFTLYCYLYKKRRFDGEMFLFYTSWYGFGRMIIEGMRTDSLWLGTMRASQVLAGLLFVASVVVELMVRSKIKRQNDPEYLKLYKYSEESQLIVAGEYDYRRGVSKAEAAAMEAAEEAAEDGEDFAKPEAQDAPDESKPEEPEAAEKADGGDETDGEEKDAREKLEDIADQLEDDFMGGDPADPTK